MHPRGHASQYPDRAPLDARRTLRPAPRVLGPAVRHPAKNNSATAGPRQVGACGPARPAQAAAFTKRGSPTDASFGRPDFGCELGPSRSGRGAPVAAGATERQRSPIALQALLRPAAARTAPPRRCARSPDQSQDARRREDESGRARPAQPAAGDWPCTALPFTLPLRRADACAALVAVRARIRRGALAALLRVIRCGRYGRRHGCSVKAGSALRTARCPWWRERVVDRSLRARLRSLERRWTRHYRKIHAGAPGSTRRCSASAALCAAVEDE